LGAGGAERRVGHTGAPERATGDITGSNIGGIGAHFQVERSFNQIDASNTGDALKSLLKDLVQQVTIVGNHLGDDDAKSAARRLDQFVDEATAEQPDRGVLRAIGEGLTRAAQTVGAVGLPVVELVEKITRLL
jgi:hypothetical protein